MKCSHCGCDVAVTPDPARVKEDVHPWFLFLAGNKLTPEQLVTVERILKNLKG